MESLPSPASGLFAEVKVWPHEGRLGEVLAISRLGLVTCYVLWMCDTMEILGFEDWEVDLIEGAVPL